MNQLPNERFTHEHLSGSAQMADKIPTQPPAEVVTPPVQPPAPGPQLTPPPQDDGGRRRIVNIVSIAVAAVAVAVALIIGLPHLLGGGSGGLPSTPSSQSAATGSSSGTSASDSASTGGDSASGAPVSGTPDGAPQPGERYTAANGDWVEFVDDQVCVLSLDGVEAELRYTLYSDNQGSNLTFELGTAFAGEAYDHHAYFVAGAALVHDGGLSWRGTNFSRP